MQKIVLIGTLHAHLTSHEELQKILEELKPQRVLVEITQDDLDSEEIWKYPPEMIFA